MPVSSDCLQKTWREKSQTPSVLDALAEQEERIAQRLRKLRADIGHPERPGKPLPIENAATRAQVKYRQWQRWEAGETSPRSTNLERVAATFGIDVSEFYETDKDASEPTQLDRIETALKHLEGEVRLLRARMAKRDAEVLKRIRELPAPTPAIRQQQQP